MELYTRIIDEGVFIFWDDSKADYYTLQINISNQDKKIRLLNLAIEKGKNYYSLTHIGSGEYEIEINAFCSDKMIETVTKKIVLTSNNQKLVELSDKLKEIMNTIVDFKSSVDRIYYALESPKNRLDILDWTEFLCELDNKKSQFRRFY